MRQNDKIVYVDDDTEGVNTLLRLRIPPLLLGLALGIVISFFASQFEDVIAHNVRVAFFLPFVVYIAAAVGTQTQAIYTRDLRSGRARFRTYLIKESILGIILGIVFAGISWVVVWTWFADQPLAWSVGLSVFLAVASAPLVALFTSEISRRLKEDPAAEAGPIGTVIQDMLSVVIYGMISSSIFLL